MTYDKCYGYNGLSVHDYDFSSHDSCLRVVTGGGVMTGGMSEKLSRAVMPLNNAFGSDGAETVQIWCKKKCARDKGQG
jgi:hypothetical protein